MKRLLILTVLFTIGRPLAHGQTAATIALPDPYRNFVGSWSGTIPISAEKMLKTATLVVTEEPDQTAMRWDYVFGVKGEEGYAQETTWIILLPAQSKLLMHRKHSTLVPYNAQGLRSFVQVGYGAFTAEVVWGKKAFSDKITLGLQPNSLSYLWETSRDNNPYRVVTKSVFRRDSSLSISPETGSKQE